MSKSKLLGKIWWGLKVVEFIWDFSKYNWNEIQQDIWIVFSVKWHIKAHEYLV